MSTLTHTPGPWRAKSTGVYAVSREAGKKEQCICQFNWMLQARFAERDANALLIAAAPDMLVALDEIVSAIRDGLRRHAAGDPNAIASNLISATLRQAEAVMRRANP